LLFFVDLFDVVGPGSWVETADFNFALGEAGDSVADEGEDGPGDGDSGGVLVVLVFLTLNFLARRVRIFSSSSEDGSGTLMSRSTGILSRCSWASAP